MDASDVLAGFRVVPVVVVDNNDHALRLAEIFMRTNLTCIEVTLRTSNALRCIEAVAGEFPEAKVGAGSVVTPQQLVDANNAGAAFAVSPGSSDDLLDAAADRILVPGAATATEVMHLLSKGYRTVKFFPAELLGGLKTIRALCEPIRGVQFFPTGGIREGNLAEYLAFDRVSCVGGSWLAPLADVEKERWEEISARCVAVQRIIEG